MEIFSIQNEFDKQEKNLAYLVYYEIEKLFYIELPDGADVWETPLLLSSFVKRDIKTVDSYWSRQWVQQRIVPAERQNIGQILKDNGLDEYDEYKLLMLSMGRCEQDDYFLVPIEENNLPDCVKSRFLTRIEDIIPLEDYNILVFFRNGKIKKCNLNDILKNNKKFSILLENYNLFYNISLQPGGYGVKWDENLAVTYDILYKNGTNVPLSLTDFKNFVANHVITSSEAADILGCSRQNIDDLTKRGKLHQIKSVGKTTLYLKSEVLQRNWQ
jgi:hypothetical protein